MSDRKLPALVERERDALGAHRETLRGGALPPPKSAPSGTFLHGFFLPFSLIAMTLRDAELRAPFVKLFLVRIALVTLATGVALGYGKVHAKADEEREAHETFGASVDVVGNDDDDDDEHDEHDQQEHKHHLRSDAGPKRVDLGPLHVGMHDAHDGGSVHIDMPGLHVNVDDKGEDGDVELLGKKVPIEKPHAAPPKAPPPKEPDDFRHRAIRAARAGWGWLLAVLAFVSTAEGVIVFLSRRWDDWISFHAARIASIVPEDPAPKPRKVALDLGWLYRKWRRRLRGYVVFIAGFPALSPLYLVPEVGPWVFRVAALVWGWYWLGVFAASKSALAWTDEATAISPVPIRLLERTASQGCIFAPLRFYGRVWARVTRSINPAVTTFERSPKPFLGLALARGILSLPGLYLLARPIIPVAAGRLCAEADPADRFSCAPPGAPSIPR